MLEVNCVVFLFDVSKKLPGAILHLLKQLKYKWFFFQLIDLESNSPEAILTSALAKNKQESVGKKEEIFEKCLTFR